MPKQDALAVALDAAASELDAASMAEAEHANALSDAEGADDTGTHLRAYLAWSEAAARLASAESFYNNTNALDIRRKREAREEAGDA